MKWDEPHASIATKLGLHLAKNSVSLALFICQRWILPVSKSTMCN